MVNSGIVKSIANLFEDFILFIKNQEDGFLGVFTVAFDGLF